MKLKAVICLLLWPLLLILVLAVGQPVGATPPRQNDTAALHLINEAEETICFVFISHVAWVLVPKLSFGTKLGVQTEFGHQRNSYSRKELSNDL